MWWKKMDVNKNSKEKSKKGLAKTTTTRKTKSNKIVPPAQRVWSLNWSNKSGNASRGKTNTWICLDMETKSGSYWNQGQYGYGLAMLILPEWDLCNMGEIPKTQTTIARENAILERVHQSLKSFKLKLSTGQHQKRWIRNKSGSRTDHI